MMILAPLLMWTQSAFTVTNSVYHGPVKRPAIARLVWRDEFNGRSLDAAKWSYDTAFNNYRMGYAAALSWLLFGVIAGFSFLQFRLLRER